MQQMNKMFHAEDVLVLKPMKTCFQIMRMRWELCT